MAKVTHHMSLMHRSIELKFIVNLVPIFNCHFFANVNLAIPTP